MSEARQDWARGRRARVAVVIASVGLGGCVLWAVLLAPADHVGSLTLVLGVAVAWIGVSYAPTRGKPTLSASFLVVMLAAAFLGPASAFGATLLADAVSVPRRRPRPAAFVVNLFGNGLLALLGGIVIRHDAPHNQRAWTFYLLIAGVALGALVLSFAILAELFIALGDQRSSWGVRVWKLYFPSIVINIVLVVAGAAIYVRLGIAGITFALAGVLAFSYMGQLVEQSRHRAEQYVSLSWGVLAGLMRSLDTRDQRAARHAAAVARFARDMAQSVGMSEQDQELAHTAGLLHDIGHFALSDRVAERGRTLTEEDWLAIQRHPELGADMLRDLGMYGPVEEIVLTHHERIDGRGYPRGLLGEEIPEIAKIISVAEVYDTLTASDTYRTRMSSFEALRELRRVAGTQLDGRYVEVLAQLLTGEGVEYRHADAADFDTELDMERRIKEAGAGG
jgi:putative nucleotidyltransferase with HDIG domain